MHVFWPGSESCRICQFALVFLPHLTILLNTWYSTDQCGIIRDCSCPHYPVCLSMLNWFLLCCGLVCSYVCGEGVPKLFPSCLPAAPIPCSTHDFKCYHLWHVGHLRPDLYYNTLLKTITVSPVLIGWGVAPNKLHFGHIFDPKTNGTHLMSLMAKSTICTCQCCHLVETMQCSHFSVVEIKYWFRCRCRWVPQHVRSVQHI